MKILSKKNTALFSLFFVFVMKFSNAEAQMRYDADVNATYFGGTGEEDNVYVTADRSGNIIIAGHTYSSNLETKYPYQPANGGIPDGFIAKFNPDMTALLFSTYLGGSGYDEIKAVAADSAGNIYVTGGTDSDDFPVTQNALSRTHHAGSVDAFLTKLSSTGQILYSTFIGGSGSDFGMGLTVVDTSIVCLVGTTASVDFPAVGGSPVTIKGGADIFVFKLELAQNSILFSSVFGGSRDDSPFNLKTDKEGNVYVSGHTVSSDFPVINVSNSRYNGNQDGFIAKLDANGNLAYSRLIGGSGNDGIVGIDIDDSGEIYFFGSSNSSGLPCTEDAFFTERIGDYDVIIGKLGSSGDSILYLSYFGGSNTDNAFDYGNNIVYHCGRIGYLRDETVAITGVTKSDDFPLTNNARDRSVSDFDAFVSVLDLARKEILYSTFLGGSAFEEADDLDVVNDTTITISGISSSANFPVSQTAYRRTNYGSSDAFIAGIRLQSITTGINEPIGKYPDAFALNQNYPNPFNPSTTIRYYLGKPSHVVVSVYNTIGQKIATIAHSFQNAGEHSVAWNGCDDSHNPVGSGIYYYSITTDGWIDRNKMVLVR